MSYIPKYILKRMFPKDCVKKVEGGVKINMVNVISPLSIDDGIPDNAEEHIDVMIDGEIIGPEKKKEMTISVDDKTYSVDKAKEFEGVVIPVGGQVEVFLPVDLSAGDKHQFDITIQTDNPFHIKVDRKVQE